jgi:hypothetical protein
MDVEYGPAKSECYFLTSAQECPNKRIPLCNFCPEHKAFFATLDNPTLIEETARTWIKSLYVNDEKKLTAKVDMELIGDLQNYVNELSERGYSDDDVSDAIASITQEKGLFDDLHKQMGRDPKWKKFEKIVAGIHMLTSQGAEVKFDDHIVGKRTGSNRQIDVSIRFKQGLYDYLAIIECKDSGRRRASIDKVEAFRTKLEDVGARHGIMVSPHGFQKGAIKAAEAYNIELFTLTEVKSDWTKTIKANVHILPWPTKIEFDYPEFDAPGLYKEPFAIQYHDVLFYKDQHSPSIPLHHLVGNMANWAVERNLSLPCIIESPLDPPLLTQFPGTSFYTPIYSITVTLEPSKFALGYEIDMPPKLVKYVYSDIAKERVHEIPANDIPPVK